MNSYLQYYIFTISDLSVLTVLSITIKYNEYATDKGGNVSIPCIAQGNIMWVKEHGTNSTIIQVSTYPIYPIQISLASYHIIVRLHVSKYEIQFDLCIFVLRYLYLFTESLLCQISIIFKIE